MTLRVLGVIPARYASSRFPGKALAQIGGISMIERVYRQALKAERLADLIVATDHDLIFEHVKSFGGNVCMTADSHVSGTDRCFEALGQQEEEFDYVVNIQGDEPFIAPKQIDFLVSMLDGVEELATLAKKITDAEQLTNPNVVKAMIGSDDHAIYFSRSPLPFFRGLSVNEWITHHDYYKHIGMYAYREDVLERITKLPVSPLEKAESLEQLRWIENGFKIKVGKTKLETIGIDTPEDLERAVRELAKQEED